MRPRLALAATTLALLAGCASDPYYGGYGGYSYYERPYYDRPYDARPYAGPSYYYGDGYPYYVTPGVGGSVYFQYRDDDRYRHDGRRHRDGRDDSDGRRDDGWRDRDRDADRPAGRAEAGSYNGEVLAPGAGRPAQPPGERAGRPR
jgi:hypothetical protein